MISNHAAKKSRNGEEMKEQAIKEAAAKMMSMMEGLDPDKVSCIKIAIMMRGKDGDAEEDYEKDQEGEEKESVRSTSKDEESGISQIEEKEED